ncbi:MAG: ribonuclease HII [Eubacteriales bacterium]|nr:ribonuclease HII [Eubacteriales bacterium]
MGAELTQKEVLAYLQGLSIEDSLSYLDSLQHINDKVYIINLINKYIRLKELRENEFDRLRTLWLYEKEKYAKGYSLVGGIDEAGRGPLAGPVVAACVVIPENAILDGLLEGLNDSKKLTPAQRDSLFDKISECAVSCGVGIVDSETIDKINILNATKLAMKKAVDAMSPKPDYLLIDALKVEQIPIRQQSIIKGDSKSASIAAASIIAKVTRDRILGEMDGKYPAYGFVKHKGYGTLEHINAIRKYGACPIHRVSFLSSITADESSITWSGTHGK